MELARGLVEALDGLTVAMVTTTLPGHTSSRPLRIREAQEHTLWFPVPPEHEQWAAELAGQVLGVAATVTFSDPADSRHVALQGRAFVDRVAHAPEVTDDDPGRPPTAVRVDVATGEWWDARAGLVGQLISLARAGLGRPDDDHGPVVV